MHVFSETMLNLLKIECEFVGYTSCQTKKTW